MKKRMDFDNIKIGLAHVQSLVEGWENAGITELERDLALEELRRVYSEIRFGSTDVANEPAAEAAAVAVPPIVAEEPAPAEEVADEDEPDEPEIEIELILPDEEESEEEEKEEEPAAVETETATEPETVSEEAIIAEPEQTEPETASVEAVAEEPSEIRGVEILTEEVPQKEIQPLEPAAEEPEPSLFGDEEILLPRSSRRRVIMSLYDDDTPTIKSRATDSKPEIKSEPAKEPSEVPAKEEPVKDNTEESESENPAAAEEHHSTAAIPAIDEETVLGDVLGADVHTLGDSIARPKGIAESAPVVSLRTAIGINDRFLLIRDLFGNDGEAYEKAIAAIDSFDNLDDCMIHIVENYSWRSSSDGAKLIMDLIQRKFRK